MRGRSIESFAFAAVIVATLISAQSANGDIVILRNDGTPATNDQALKWQDSQGEWHIVLQALYAPSGVTLYEIRGNGGETIKRVIIHVPCWKGPSGECVPAGSPVFVRVLSDPPFGVQSVHEIVQSGTAETLLTHVLVNEDIGYVNVDAVGILEAGRDILGPVIAKTPDNPNRGIGSAAAGRHILGDLTAMKGRIGSVKAGENIGSPDEPIKITFKHNSLDLEAKDVHADIDTRVAGGNGHLWRFEADRYFGTLRTPHIGHHWQTSAAGSVRVREKLIGSFEIGGSLDDPEHQFELPPGGIQGQVIVNADNIGGMWSAPIALGPPTHPDHKTLATPEYGSTSEQLGGGAIGLVPFRLHHASSSPPSKSTIIHNPEDDAPTVELDHYGPIVWSGGPPVLIERRMLETGTFEVVPLDEFDIVLSPSNPRGLQIKASEHGHGFESGFEYRITPTMHLRSAVADAPPVVWREPYFVTFSRSETEPDDPDDPDLPSQPTDPDGPPACIGDLNGDGVVNVLDLLDMLSSWGPCEWCAADLNDDAAVNVFDLLILLAHWGPC